MTATPLDLVIRPRNIRFESSIATKRWWLGDDPIATAWYNSLSASFPQGEAFFIQSVRRFRKEVPPKLAAEIEAFAKQEGYHTREHVGFNEQIALGGYDLKPVEARLTERFEAARKIHPVAQLCVTVALEHFTAIFANLILKDKDVFADSSSPAQRLWKWHAIEEVEHKSVAFDTYMHVTRDLKPLKRWAIRSLVFWNVSRQFVTTRAHDALEFMAADGITGWSARRRLTWYLLGRPGPMLRLFPMWLTYFRPGFHPWEHDDRNLLAHAEAVLNLEAQA